ncbi:MAG TPA: substrate-binding domain-containing protein [Methylomirabilota bacterium]|nr:substrate-binding domain-containing protein [Methylomirabilota bacterium]
MTHRAPASSPRGRRRSCLRRWASSAGALVVLAAALSPAAAQRTYLVAFANLTEEPGVTLEGTGFTGREIRESFTLAARAYPLEMVYYDNQRDDARALANAEAAIARKVDLYIQYHRGGASVAVAEKLKAAGIKVLAVNAPIAGVPLYTADNLAAGRVAGEALAQFALRAWRGQPMAAAIVGPVSAAEERVPERVQGVTQALGQRLPGVRVTALDTRGNPAQVGPLVGKFLATHPTGRLLLAATDDATALAVKAALEAGGRVHDSVIVSHGVDRSIHGGMNDRREIDPSNRGSILVGSVAFYLDRYGYEVLPLAMRMLRGEAVPARVTTRHVLVTAANVFSEYPPYDMN